MAKKQYPAPYARNFYKNGKPIADISKVKVPASTQDLICKTVADLLLNKTDNEQNAG